MTAIVVTVANEDRLVSEFRDFLRKQARQLVADSPERIGKYAALVHLPEVTQVSVFTDEALAEVRFQWV